ncbi:amidase [Povalibacter sp.]|uniref:amidase n=1 Tax=Povalibacter sp. TaxID=1962978 RepID=UPI002F42CA51
MSRPIRRVDAHSSSRRAFLRATAASAAGIAMAQSLLRANPARASAIVSPDTSDNPIFMSAARLAKLIRDRKLSATEAVRTHIARIEAVNPKINAVVAMCFERALEEAATADAALARGESMGPLHGVPMTIKDSFDTQGVVSTGGTLGRRNFVPAQDATVVARARAAGAILLGKTNTPEFTLGGGWKGTINLVYGVTRNPYDPNYQPGASSGGSGANVAAGGASFDIGSDYGGSMRIPATSNGIVTLKPTYGRSPRTGHIIGYGGPFDSFQETGPLTRWVEDLALLMPILCGPDNRDCAMAPVPFGDPAAVDLTKLRVAYAIPEDGTPEVQAALKKCVGYFEELGCSVKDDAPPKVKELGAARSAFSAGPGADWMQRQLAKHGTKQAAPGLWFGGEPTPCADFTRACEEMDVLKSEQLAWVENYDLFICAVSSRGVPLPVDDGDLAKVRAEMERPAKSLSFTGNFNTNGWPAGVVRVGESVAHPELPFGVQVVAQPWRDDVVIAALAYIESRTGGYKPPKI